MTQKLYTEAYIQNIANAIRGLNKTTNKYKVSQMAEAIQAVSGGISANHLIIGTASYTSSNLEVS